MKLFVGITDEQWFRRLSELEPDEVNFWKPGAHGSFGILKEGELFLFKLHSPMDYIVGGGHFVKFSKLPVSLAWQAFGEKNGVASIGEFRQRIKKYRKKDIDPDPSIGNIILNHPFWLKEGDWIKAPRDWPKSTVQGKTYDEIDSRGHELFVQVRERLGVPTLPGLTAEDRRYTFVESKMRLGQGGFRVVVTDAYKRKCAITGENTLDVLEAAHIRPYSANGPHAPDNGLLLRSDMHTLFDKGLLTVDPDLRIKVSSLIREKYVNGKIYYSYDGQELKSIPTDRIQRPNPDFLDWHNRNVFLV
jgi:putative restriction endonuclease